MSRARGDTATLLRDLEPRLLRVLVARYGLEVGREVTAEAIAWGWEHADRMDTMSNPGGYLYRVGQTAARKLRRVDRERADFPAEPVWQDAPDVAGDVFDELRRLKPEQRVAVLLVHGYGYSYGEVGQLLNISAASVTNHVHRGLAKLRTRMEDK